MKILKESFIKESYGPKTLSKKELWEYGYDIEGDTGRFAQSKTSDGVEFDIVGDNKYDDVEVMLFPDNSDEDYILRIDNCKSENDTSNLMNKLEGMTFEQAISTYPSAL